jgi:Fic family protein
MLYNWQQPDWPDFKFDPRTIEDALFAFAQETGHVSGMLNALPEELQLETITNMLIAEAIKTSAIEGEYISRQDVVSSIRNQLGLNVKPDPVKDKRAQGVSELVVDVRNTYKEELTNEKLFEWHKVLLKHSKGINLGTWRKDEAPMQVVSGSIGNEKVHFEAPPSSGVPYEMDRFMLWFNETAPGGKREIGKASVRAAIAHLYFESIHPFEDGNGRIGRAIAEKALSQTIGRPVLLSLSATIESNKSAYYNALETAQRSNEITGWMSYFVNTILEAQQQTRQLIDLTLAKTKFFDRFKNDLNERQLKAISKMLEAGPEGFEGGMTARKYISITRASKATATRDLQELVELGALVSEGKTRSIHYSINF